MAYRIDVQDNIAIFTIDNPPVNSINTEVLEGLDTILDRVNTEEELKGLIVTGTGNIFSSGFDLGTFSTFEGPEHIERWFRYEEEVFYKLFTCPKPLVGAANGHASAGGLIILQACDYRMMKNDPKLKVGMSEIKLGMSLSPCHAEIMRFGLETNKNWKEVIYNGQRIPAPVALEMGILDELVAEAELLEKAKAKVCEYIDTPNRPFISLKEIQRRFAVQKARQGIDTYDLSATVATFTNPAVVKELRATYERITKGK